MQADALDSPSTPRQHDGGGRLGFAALALLFMVLSAVAALSAISDQTAFSEYLTQARRCVELNDCPARGGRTGALPIFHGALWIRLLAYSQQPGNDQATVQTIILVLWLLSIPATFLFLRRYLGLRAAALGAGLYFQVILVGTDITIFTYTNLLPLPFAIYYFGIALFAETRRVVWGAVASVALAVAVSAELGTIVMVPFHLLLALILALRPLSALVAVGLALAIPFALESSDAALEILRQVPTWRFAIGLTISAAMMAVAAGVSRRLLQSAASTGERVHVVMAGALVYSALTIWIACTLLMGNAPGPRYFLPASFPFLYLVAERMSGLGAGATIAVAGLALVSLLLLPLAPLAQLVLQVPVFLIVTLYAIAELVRLMRRRSGPVSSMWAPVAVCAFALALAAADLLVSARRGQPQTLTMAEGERLVPKLYANGFTYPDLLASLQGPAVDDLMSLVTEHDPKVFSEPAQYLVEPTASLLVLEVPEDVVGRTAGVVAVVPAGGGRSAIAVRGEPAFLQWTKARRCGWRSDGDGGGAYRCEAPRMDEPLPHNWPYVRLRDAVAEPALAMPDGGGDRVIRYRVPVRTPGRGQAHIVRTTNEWPSTWQIVAVSGVEFEGALPGAEVRLPDRQAATGTIDLELHQAIPGDPPWVWAPHLLEVTEENEHLLEAFRSASS